MMMVSENTFNNQINCCDFILNGENQNMDKSLRKYPNLLL